MRDCMFLYEKKKLKKKLHRASVISVHGSTSILHTFSRKSASYEFNAVYKSSEQTCPLLFVPSLSDYINKWNLFSGRPK